jgi:hypothetical protein
VKTQVKKMRTSNIEHPTSNIEVQSGFSRLLFTSAFDVRRSMFDVRIGFFQPMGVVHN